MKNSAFLVGILALALSACGDVPVNAGGSPSVTKSVAPSSTVPVDVGIVGGKIDAPNETYTYANQMDIVWTISTSGNYTFPDNGIVFQKPGFFICRPNQGGKKTFTCTKNGHLVGEKYKYTVNVNAGSNPLAPLDPWILNQ